MKKYRPAVGMLVGDLLPEYSKNLTAQIRQCLAEKDIDLRVFLGSDPEIVMPDTTILNVGLGYHYYSMYSYSNYDALDVLILFYLSRSTWKRLRRRAICSPRP